MPTIRKPLKKTQPSPKKTEVKGGFCGKSPLAAIIHGPPKVGKTEFAAHFPKAAFVIDPQEDGISDLVEFGTAPEPVFIQEVASFPALLDMTTDIASGSYDIETVVFDSWTGFELLMFHFHCNEYYEGNWSSTGFLSFQQGPKNAAKVDLPRFIDGLEAIGKQGINVIIIAHSEVKSFANPTGPDYDRFSPVCDKACWQRLHRWAKGIFFYNYHVEILEKKKTGPKSKANTETEQRFIYTQWNPAYDAGNRYRLDPLIDAGESGGEAFHNFKEAFLRAANNKGD